MTVIVDFAIDAESFVLGRAVRKVGGISVELVKMIPAGDSEIPYFWVRGEDQADFDDVLEAEPELQSFEVVDEFDSRSLYRAEWDPTVDTFVQAMADHDAILQEAHGDAEAWDFQILFPDSHELSEFHTHCREAGVDVSVERLYNPVEATVMDASDVTQEQRALIGRLYEEGYFEVPRQTTLAEVAEEMGISDQAVNERLRRGLQSLIGTSLRSSASGGV